MGLWLCSCAWTLLCLRTPVSLCVIAFCVLLFVTNCVVYCVLLLCVTLCICVWCLWQGCPHPLGSLIIPCSGGHKHEFCPGRDGSAGWMCINALASNGIREASIRFPVQRRPKPHPTSCLGNWKCYTLVKRPACCNTFALGLTNAHHNALVKEANPFPRRCCAEILALSTPLIDRRFSHQPNFYSTAGQQIWTTGPFEGCLSV